MCQNSVAPSLPSSSTEGVTGTWNPDAISTVNAGTVTYTFTPNDPTQCAVQTTIDITVVPEVTPTFDPIGPLCQNSVAPDLPDASIEGITGTWSPDAISTAAAGTVTYVFTPNDPAQCAVQATIDITVNPEMAPIFDPIAPICAGDALSPLPTVSNEGVTGSWSPDLNNTETTTYTFTPSAGQCATPVTLIIVVNAAIAPIFEPIGPLCQNSEAPVLPAISTNGITGTWEPAVINTTVTGTSEYVFTPYDDQCATPVTMNIVVTDEITPTFTQIGPLVLNSNAPSLPSSSIEGITGTWTPNDISTAVAGTITYTFIPATGQCATITTMDITVVAPDLTIDQSSNRNWLPGCRRYNSLYYHSN